LGYPGGPAVEKIAGSGKTAYSLPRAWLKGSYDFSFSGLKTALWHLVEREQIGPGDSRVADIAASFQAAIVDVLVAKTSNTARELEANRVLLSGGVSANTALRHGIVKSSPVDVLVPPIHLCTDNAAMVAACGYYHLLQGEISDYYLDILPSLNFTGPYGRNL